MEKRKLPIAVVDSGVGGISVLAELKKALPHEDFLYFGDSLNAPYGTKSRDEVLAITRSNLQTLMERGIKAFVLACNTATSAAARVLREEYPDLPIIGVEPAVKPAAMLCESPTVLVMATALTLREEKFNLLVDRFAHRAKVIPLPCTGLVEMIEAGILDGKPLDDYLGALFSPYKQEKIDAVVLGCTHYPHVRAAIAAHFPVGTPILDGGEGTARQTGKRLAELSLLREEDHTGKVEILNSSGDPALLALSRTLLERATNTSK